VSAILSTHGNREEHTQAVLLSSAVVRKQNVKKVIHGTKRRAAKKRDETRPEPQYNVPKFPTKCSKQPLNNNHLTIIQFSNIRWIIIKPKIIRFHLKFNLNLHKIYFVSITINNKKI